MLLLPWVHLHRRGLDCRGESQVRGHYHRAATETENALFLLVGYWYIIGIEAGRMMIKSIFLNGFLVVLLVEGLFSSD